MKIKLDEKYYIMSSNHQYVLGEKSGDGIISIGFFNSLNDLLNGYITICCITKDNITTVQDLLDYQNSLLVGLNEALAPLKIKVVTSEQIIKDNSGVSVGEAQKRQIQ